MSENCAKSAGISPDINQCSPPVAMDARCARPHVSELLRNKATNLRRQAGYLHEEANNLEKLSWIMQGQSGDLEGTLNTVLSDCLHRIR